MTRSVRQLIGRARKEVDTRAAHLESLSPLAILARGYSVTLRRADGKLIRDASELALGSELHTRFAVGEAISRVERIGPE
jgi:exodeoxyribonuclease VII large subunit